MLRVVELFAGVGGFRLGLEGWYGAFASTNYLVKEKEQNFTCVWSNQWEPKSKKQSASLIYCERFGERNHTNQDITTIREDEIPNHDLLCAGFPCQDYSVAVTSDKSKGIRGKKGVLWWQIHRILVAKRPHYVVLENVDRLLKSPAKQRGRDFAIILACLNDLGYTVEWRVINAADYGMPQKRKRTFIVAYHENSDLMRKYNHMVGGLSNSDNMYRWVVSHGVTARAFPGFPDSRVDRYYSTIPGSLGDISESFNEKNESNVFQNAGVAMRRQYMTMTLVPSFVGPKTVLKDILVDESTVPDEYIIPRKDLAKWKKFKSAKKEKRVHKGSGVEYTYSEGQMKFPDDILSPSRTIITSEGGPTPSRFKHVVCVNGRYRRLLPVELERLNMFPDGFTDINSLGKAIVNDRQRAFLMGNALVVGVVERLGDALIDRINA